MNTTMLQINKKENLKMPPLNGNTSTSFGGGVVELSPQTYSYKIKENNQMIAVKNRIKAITNVRITYNRHRVLRHSRYRNRVQSILQVQSITLEQHCSNNNKIRAILNPGDKANLGHLVYIRTITTQLCQILLFLIIYKIKEALQIFSLSVQCLTIIILLRGYLTLRSNNWQHTKMNRISTLQLHSRIIDKTHSIIQPTPHIFSTANSFSLQRDYHSIRNEFIRSLK